MFTESQKKEIIRMKLMGHNHTTIADKMHCTRQTVSQYLKDTFELDEEYDVDDSIELPELQDMIDYCISYAKLSDIDEVSTIYNVPKEYVVKSIRHLLKRQYLRDTVDPYPQITRYLVSKSKTRAWLAKAIGCSKRSLVRTLDGYQDSPMKLAMAEKINELTGLRFEQIYEYQLLHTLDECEEEETPIVIRASFVKPPKKKKGVPFIQSVTPWINPEA